MIKLFCDVCCREICEIRSRNSERSKNSDYQIQMSDTERTKILDVCLGCYEEVEELVKVKSKEKPT
jgi:hypothetical protein